ncbi:MAG: YheT family hydrolase [Geminicoccaceae bacterium]
MSAPGARHLPFGRPPAFNPRSPWWGGDLQTVRNYARQASRTVEARTDERLIIALDDGTGDRLAAALSLPAGWQAHPLILLIHGISGCEGSGYMKMATAFFVQRGYGVLRINLRGAGPSRPLCKREYHAGSSHDLARVIERLDPKLTGKELLPVGFSLGGNLLLKFLGTVGERHPVKRAATVSAPIDLSGSCRSILRWRNLVYHRYIFPRLRQSCMDPGAELSDSERQALLEARNLWQLDDRFIARRNGYDGAEDYYRQNSATNFLGAIKQPTLLIHARNDPFVPVTPYLDPRWAENQALTLLLPDGGGHLGFHDPAGLWHLRQIEAFFKAP